MENKDESVRNNSTTDPTMSNGSPDALITAHHLSRKRWSKVVLLASIIIVIVSILSLWINASKAHNGSTKITATTPAPKPPAPLVTTSAPASLKAGTYTVGLDKNIAPGLYSLSPGAQQSGTFTIVSPNANHSVALNDSATGAGSDTKVAWGQLSDGDKVEISGGNLAIVNFKVVATSSSTPSALAKLYDNTVVVTNTPNRVNPGKYYVTDTDDTIAYMLVVGKNNTIKYNEPLNSTGFHVVLEDGDQIATINMNSYKMQPE